MRVEMERHEGASQAYETAGLQILELAQSAYSSYVTKNSREQARLVKNSRIELHVRSRKSFSDLHKAVRRVREWGKTGDWLLRLDSNQQPSG